MWQTQCLLAVHSMYYQRFFDTVSRTTNMPSHSDQGYTPTHMHIHIMTNCAVLRSRRRNSCIHCKAMRVAYGCHLRLSAHSQVCCAAALPYCTPTHYESIIQSINHFNSNNRAYKKYRTRTLKNYKHIQTHIIKLTKIQTG